MAETDVFTKYQLASDDLEAMLLDAIGSVTDASSAIYVAGPLATGLEYYELVAKGETSPNLRPKNEARMRDAIKKLRCVERKTVIDPSVLKLSGKTDTEIGDFFIKVLSLFADEVRLLPGWEFSSGATKEIGYSIIFGKNIADIDGNSISQAQAAARVKDAANHLDRIGIAQHKLHQRLKLIEGASPGNKIT